jgi:Secretion system C-terminal sorting domain
MSPNPASDVLNLDMNFEKPTDIQVRIFNNIGQVVWAKKMENILRGSQTLDLSRLNAGIYAVEISDGQIRTNKKLVISR